ncbi:phage tail protein [Loigolactobacillus bifermentans]|nr:phage tail protein [Loigolactobacillus bifermentans]
MASTELRTKLDAVRGKTDPNDGIYNGTPDFDNWTDIQIVDLSPWLRISDLPGDAAEYSDDDRLLEYPRVQVDFWTRKELLPDASAIDEIIKKVMHDAGWERVYHNSYADHDTPALRMTIAYFQSQGLPV